MNVLLTGSPSTDVPRGNQSHSVAYSHAGKIMLRHAPPVRLNQFVTPHDPSKVCVPQKSPLSPLSVYPGLNPLCHLPRCEPPTSPELRLPPSPILAIPSFEGRRSIPAQDERLQWPAGNPLSRGCLTLCNARVSSRNPISGPISASPKPTTSSLPTDEPQPTQRLLSPTTPFAPGGPIAANGPLPPLRAILGQLPEQPPLPPVPDPEPERLQIASQQVAEDVPSTMLATPPHTVHGALPLHPVVSPLPTRSPFGPGGLITQDDAQRKPLLAKAHTVAGRLPPQPIYAFASPRRSPPVAQVTVGRLNAPRCSTSAVARSASADQRTCVYQRAEVAEVAAETPRKGTEEGHSTGDSTDRSKSNVTCEKCDVLSPARSGARPADAIRCGVDSVQQFADVTPRKEKQKGKTEDRADQASGGKNSPWWQCSNFASHQELDTEIRRCGAGMPQIVPMSSACLDTPTSTEEELGRTANARNLGACANPIYFHAESFGNSSASEETVAIELEAYLPSDVYQARADEDDWPVSAARLEQKRWAPERLRNQPSNSAKASAEASAHSKCGVPDDPISPVWVETHLHTLDQGREDLSDADVERKEIAPHIDPKLYIPGPQRRRASAVEAKAPRNRLLHCSVWETFARRAAFSDSAEDRPSSIERAMRHRRGRRQSRSDGSRRKMARFANDEDQLSPVMEEDVLTPRLLLRGASPVLSPTMLPFVSRSMAADLGISYESGPLSPALAPEGIIDVGFARGLGASLPALTPERVPDVGLTSGICPLAPAPKGILDVGLACGLCSLSPENAPQGVLDVGFPGGSGPLSSELPSVDILNLGLTRVLGPASPALSPQGILEVGLTHDLGLLSPALCPEIGKGGFSHGSDLLSSALSPQRITEELGFPCRMGSTCETLSDILRVDAPASPIEEVDISASSYEEVDPPAGPCKEVDVRPCKPEAKSEGFATAPLSEAFPEEARRGREEARRRTSRKEGRLEPAPLRTSQDDVEEWIKIGRPGRKPIEEAVTRSLAGVDSRSDSRDPARLPWKQDADQSTSKSLEQAADDETELPLTEQARYKRQPCSAKDWAPTAPLEASECALRRHIWANEELWQGECGEDEDIKEENDEDPLLCGNVSLLALRFEHKIVEAATPHCSTRRAATIQNVQESKTMFEKEIQRSMETRLSTYKIEKVQDVRTTKSKFEGFNV